MNRLDPWTRCMRDGFATDSRFWRQLQLIWLLFLIFHFMPCNVLPAQYSPEHPKVQQMVQRAIRFLETTEDRGSRGGEYESGGPILMGYTVFKVTGDEEHPLAKSAIGIARQLAQKINTRNYSGESKIVYEASMAAVLLATVDAVRFKPELNQILTFFAKIQKPHGGFGYLGRPTGDTSQVQYVMLAFWTLHEVGLDVSPSMVENTLRYLLDTTDPSGGWGYQGVVSAGRPVPQDKVSKSLATAGAGALMMGGDILGFYGIRKPKGDQEEGVPDAFVRVDLRDDVRRQRRETTMSRSDLEGALNVAARFQNTTRFSGNWYYYWRYSQERYESFVEIVENRQEKSPGWYNQGVDELARLQDDSGGWGENRKVDVTPPAVCTSFSILFLIRSTRKAIGELDEGFVFGGSQLPEDVTNVRMLGDRIVSQEETSMENLLSMLEDDKAGGIEVGLLSENLQLSTDPAQRKEQIARLSRLILSGDYKARQIAARLLGRTDDLTVAPDLIYALTDPNDLVPMIAEESLRLLSRRLNAGQLEENPTQAERSAAEAFWKDWYLGLHPEYIFIDR